MDGDNESHHSESEFYYPDRIKHGKRTESHATTLKMTFNYLSNSFDYQIWLAFYHKWKDIVIKFRICNV